MPTVLRVGPYRFGFYSDERDEPPHVHVSKPDCECKYWLEPVRLARNKGIPAPELRVIEKLVYAHLDLLKGKYNERPR
ncbi:MAG: DUF4160 domain-containing protein [Sulfuricella sp.]|nr:DUF4160 domain-containing protein [Sulfuricella sp.]